MKPAPALSFRFVPAGLHLARRRIASIWAAAVCCMVLGVSVSHGAEIHTLDETFLPAGANAAVPPTGKEADWILGDSVLCNDRIVAVIAKPVATRNANMTVKNVGGCVIDLTMTEQPNDQLSCYYPGGGRHSYRELGNVAVVGEASAESAIADGSVSGKGNVVSLELVAPAGENTPRAVVTYTLADGDDFLTVKSVYRNPHENPVTVELEDRVRADRSFTAAADATASLAWWDDEWFGQAYGLIPATTAASVRRSLATVCNS